MVKTTIILYDGITQFNEIPVEKINKAWGDEKYILVYKNDKFTGIAQPLGTKTLEEWQVYFQEHFEQMEIKKQQEAQRTVTMNGINETVVQTDEHVLNVMEGLAASYEAQQENSMAVMEGIASIHEANLI